MADLADLAFPEVFETRGWSLKHGHRKRLVRAQEESLEEPRLSSGRSTVKRSLHVGSRRSFLCPTEIGSYGEDHLIHTRRAKLRQQMKADLLEASAWAEKEYEYAWECGWEEDEEEEEEDEWAGAASASEEEETLSLASFQTCRSSASESTAASARDPKAGKPKASKAPERWQQALGRANLTAKKYVQSTQEPSAQTSKHRQVKSKAQRIADSLKDGYNVKLVDQDLGPSPQSAFESFRVSFLEQFSGAICSGLRGVFAGEVLLRATPTSKPVQERFLREWASRKGDLSAVFHGTDEKNLPSIYEKGLLVPGGDKGVNVLHGASHGNGIYTAKTSNPALSFGFCHGEQRPMLVCGVLDDAVKLPRPQLLGRHYVTAESQRVRHVGDAIVVFDESCVIPLFEASSPNLSLAVSCPAAAPAPARIPAVEVPSTRQIPMAQPKVYNGGPKTRLRKRPDTRDAKVVAFLHRRAARVRYSG